MNITLQKVTDIHPYPGNPRINDNAVDPVANSIREFGFQQPIVVDTDGVVVVGHTRLLAAKKLGLTEVPTVVATNLSPDQVRAYRLADNRTNQNAEWDWGLVGEELLELMESSPDLVPVTGFDKEELRKATTWDKGRGKRDFEPQAKPDPLTKYGDVWTSTTGGEHTVLCTENTSDQFKTFIADKLIDCIITDPPYNISYASGKGVVNNDTFDSQAAFTEFLHTCFTPAVSKLRAGGALFTCGNEHCHHANITALEPLGVALKYELFWVKDRFVYSQGPMQFMKQHENIWVGWKEGAARHENPAVTGRALLLDDRQDWDKLTKDELLTKLKLIHESFSTVREASHERDKWAVHPTVKPTALFVPLIRKSTLPGDTVLDIFAGAGVTSLACQELGRNSISVELDPNYVDCILARLYEHHGVDFTNQDGTLWSTIWEQEKTRRELEEES